VKLRCALRAAARSQPMISAVASGEKPRYIPAMDRDQIIERLKEREADLRAQGVTHAALFGSVARGEQRPDSDIDIVVDLDPEIVRTVFDYAGVKDFIADLFEGQVDVVHRDGLKHFVRPRATADAIYAF